MFGRAILGAYLLNVSKDKDQGIKLIQESAESGNAGGQYMLFRCLYYKIPGIQKDEKSALKLLEQKIIWVSKNGFFRFFRFSLLTTTLLYDIILTDNNVVIMMGIFKIMVTIKDIACEAGVSYSTVSVAIGNRKTKLPLAPATKELVLATAKKLGYRRNALAEQIRTGRTKTISFFTVDASQEYVTRILLGVMEKADIFGYSVRVCNIGAENPRETYDRMLEMRQDAVIAIGKLPEQQYLVAEAHKLGIPVANADCELDSGFDFCVYSDSEHGEFEATEYLYSLGWRDFLFVSDDVPRHRYVENRRRGFDKALAKHSLKGRIIETPEAIPEFLRTAGKIRAAVVCSSDFVALKFIVSALAAGFKVPEDFAVIGFGALDFHQTMEMSTISQNFEEIGRISAKAVLERAAKPSPPGKLTIPTTIIKLKTTQSA